MALENKAVIDFSRPDQQVQPAQAVIIPVVWGEQQHHGNALNIFLPDSQTPGCF
jgi:hypothetical protein